MFLRFKNINTKHDVNGKSSHILHIDDILIISRDDNEPRDDEGRSTARRQPKDISEAIAQALMGDVSQIDEKVQPVEDRSEYAMVVLNDGARIYTGSKYEEVIDKLANKGLFLDL